MRTKRIGFWNVVMIAGCLGATACSRHVDATERPRAATPAEGGATSGVGSAGEAKNFGDTRKKTQVEGQTSTSSPTGMSKDVVTGKEPSYSKDAPAATPPAPPAAGK